MLPSFLKYKPADPTHRNEELIPEYTANLLDKISFGWIFPLLKVHMLCKSYSTIANHSVFAHRQGTQDRSRKKTYGTSMMPG